MSENRLRVWLRLFWMFTKVNLLSTSGPASIMLLYKEAVGNIMSEAQFVEAVGFSNVLPGSGAVKLAMFVGYEAAGWPGVFAAMLGTVLPPSLAMLIMVGALERARGAAWLQGFVRGMAPSVAMLMMVVAWKIFHSERGKKLKRRAVFIALLSLVAFLLNIPSPLVLLGAGLLGIVLFR